MEMGAKDAQEQRHQNMAQLKGTAFETPITTAFLKGVCAHPLWACISTAGQGHRDRK